jgi:RNA-directed DNA polymerase
MDGASGWTPEAGTPQGAVISPLLSNIYLNQFDLEMKAAGYEMVRYADDWLVLCKSAEDAQKALAYAEELLGKLGLELHPDKTQIVDAIERTFDFLGYTIKASGKEPSDKALKKLKDAIRNKTRRANGHSLNKIISNVNSTTVGWYTYFNLCRPWSFDKLDGWIRNRIRAILRHRRNQRGRARGRDYQRWNNAFFAEQGLFSIKAASESAWQSSSR